MFQQLAQSRTSQMPLPTTESSGAMTDASKRRIEDAEFEVDTEPDWVVGSSFMEPVGGTGHKRPCFQLVLQIWLCGERPSSHLESMRKRRRVTRLSSRKTPATFHGVENT